MVLIRPFKPPLILTNTSILRNPLRHPRILNNYSITQRLNSTHLSPPFLVPLTITLNQVISISFLVRNSNWGFPRPSHPTHHSRMYLTKAAIRYALSCPDLVSLPTEVIPHLLLDAESAPGLEPVDCPITISCHPSTCASWANYTELLLQETFHFWNAHLCIMPSPAWNALVTFQISYCLVKTL